MVTPETLTDEMIMQLRTQIAGRVFPAAGMAHTGLSDLWHDTEDALAVDPNAFASPKAAGSVHQTARQRVCDAINARGAKP